jgi:hypothetical protein
MLTKRQSAISTPTTLLKCRSVVGTLETAFLDIMGLYPSREGIDADEGPRYVSKKDDVGGGISGGNWCWPAHRNGTTRQKKIGSFPWHYDTVSKKCW